MDAIEQVTELINKADTLLIILPKQPNFDQLGSALSLFYTLNKSGKIVNLLPKKLPWNYPLKPKQKSLPKNFVITIRDKEVTELRYEREKRVLKIFLTIKDGQIDRNNIQIQALPEPNKKIDLIITIGIQNLEQIGSFYEKNFKLFYETPILNIDNQKTNNQFGSLNLLNEKSALSLILKELLSKANYKIDKNVGLWLLSGTIGYLEKEKKNNDEKTLANLLALISTGIDYQKLLAIFCKKNDAQTKLLQESLKALEVLEEKNLPIITLSSEKFKKTNTTSQDIKFLLQQLITKTFCFPRLLLIWQSLTRPEVQAVFYSHQKELNQKIKKEFQGQEKGKAILFSINTKDPHQAKKQILKIIS